MKKLFNGRFLFILISSLSVLIFLGVGAYFLFDDSDATFVKSGYVLNPLSDNKEKYYFDKDVSYKENLSGMVEFNDKDNKEVNILKDSFLHYNDSSLSFLKNGAILDLNSINGDNPVTFYNITKDSIIDRNGNEYKISSSTGDINLSNFIGRINDDKYIIVGNLNLKIQGNDQNITGDYFEIVYVEEGIINIENDDVKYQIAADSAYIYVNGLTIDLGNKKIVNGMKDVMSLTAITIDGNENIEIIPKEEENEGDNPTGPGGENGTGGNGVGGNGTGDNGTGTDGGNGTGGKGGNIDNPINDIIVTLKDAKIGSIEITTIFDIYNATEEDKFALKVINLDTYTEIELDNNEVVSEKEFYIGFLSPNTKYLFTVINEKDGNKYFQKILETNEFGIKLEKEYTTDSGLYFKVTFDEGTDVTSAKLSLLKYNEDSKQNEIVKVSYDGGATTKDCVYVIKNTEKPVIIPFDGLESNSIYTAVLNGVVISSGDFKDEYEIVLNTMTLKKTPSFRDMLVTKNAAEGSFKLSLDNIIDDDNAIINYTYLVYEKGETEKTVIPPIVKTNASPIEIKIGDKENQLKNDTNYFYKVVIEYYDNEKYVEYTTSDTINFVMESDPLITVEKNEYKISYDTIGATIYLTDNSCLISIPGRENCPETNNISVLLQDKNEKVLRTIPINMNDISVTDGEIKFEVSISNLEEDTDYYIDVMADINYPDGMRYGEIIEHVSGDNRKIRTKSLSYFRVEWDPHSSDEKHVINVDSKFIGVPGTGTLSPEDTANAIKKIVVNLYDGAVTDIQGEEEAIASKEIFDTEEFDIKENFYDNEYAITSDGLFGMTLNDFRQRGIKTYHLTINAYYDNGGSKLVRFSPNTNVIEYTIPDYIFEVYTDPDIDILPIKNNKTYGDLSDNTVIGYEVKALIDPNLTKENYTPSLVNFYVYDMNGNQMSFYTDTSKDNLVNVTSLKIDEVAHIYLDNGNEYSSNDNIMRRGNNYYIGYEIVVKTSSEDVLYPANVLENIPREYGYYANLLEYFDSKDGKPLKEEAKILSYISSTSANTATYKYYISDPDSTLYKDNDKYYIYYYVNNGEENKLEISSIGKNIYSGSISLKELSKNDVYTLYLKTNILRTGDSSSDIRDTYFNTTDDDNSRLFEGYYDAKDNEYNFKYEIINNESTDNKVIIKFLTKQELLERILSYKIKFSSTLYKKDTNGEYTNKTFEAVKEVEFVNLVSCSELMNVSSSGNDDNRCISFGYDKFKDEVGNTWNMKSDEIKTNNIKVEVTAYYDNGLNGIDFVVGADKDNYDYSYMILQNNSSGSKKGNYISYKNNGNLSVWENSNEFNTKGYYTYKLSSTRTIDGTDIISKTKIIYKGTKYSKDFGLNLFSNGYKADIDKLGTVNFKMVSYDKMAANGNDTFSFGSFIPKINVKEKTKLINGAVETISLTSVDYNDFKNEGTKKNPKYYLYVDIWDNEEYVDKFHDDGSYVYTPARSRMPFLIENDTFDATIDGLASGKTFYYAVYAYLYDSSEKDYTYTRLFSAKYPDKWQAETYSFTAMKSSDIYMNRSDISVVSDKDVYGNRSLKTTLYLKPYANNWPFNYSLSYVLCDNGECNLDTGYIYKGKIEEADVKKDQDIIIDVSYDNLDYQIEYGKKYWLKVYAIAYLDDESKGNEQAVEFIERAENLPLLEEATFNLTRRATITEDSKYAIEFDIKVVDNSRVLIGGATNGIAATENDKGRFFVALTDVNTGNIAGTLQVKENGEWVNVSYTGDDYTSYLLDVSNVPDMMKYIRITDLDPDTLYSFKVYGNEFMNNYSEDTSIEYRIKVASKKMEKAYSTNTYGVAFGKEVVIGATETSFIGIFQGGSSFEKVAAVEYTIGWVDTDKGVQNITGGFEIDGVNKKFDWNQEQWELVLKDDADNNSGCIYNVKVSFTIRVKDDTSETGYREVPNAVEITRDAYWRNK